MKTVEVRVTTRRGYVAIHRGAHYAREGGAVIVRDQGGKETVYAPGEWVSVEYHPNPQQSAEFVD